VIPVADAPGHAGDRARAPGETLARVRPHLPALGITRVGLLTGLDRLGLPVAVAARPNGKCLSVHLGKGLREDDALVSATMEAVEVALAERATGEATATPARDDGPAPLVDLARLTRCRVRAIDRATPIPVTRGTELMTGRPRSVPTVLVTMDHTGAPQAAFDQSSDGLASGNTEEEAILHGLLELVERDAVALAGSRPPEALAVRRRAPQAFADPDLAALAARIEAAGLRLGLFDVTSDIGIPVFTALLAPTAGKDAVTTAGAATAGHAAHPDPARAAVAATLEACQARLAAAAGARDDIGLRWYAAADLGAAVEAVLAARADRARVDRTPACGRAAADRISDALMRLAARGIREVVAVPLPGPVDGIHAVRMIVPGLEIGPGAPGRTVGRRLLAAHLGALA
jgi:ribosomal protein S12 methylthiotransferase accessory factor